MSLQIRPGFLSVYFLSQTEFEEQQMQYIENYIHSKKDGIKYYQNQTKGEKNWLKSYEESIATLPKLFLINLDVHLMPSNYSLKQIRNEFGQWITSSKYTNTRTKKKKKTNSYPLSAGRSRSQLPPGDNVPFVEPNEKTGLRLRRGHCNLQGLDLEERELPSNNKRKITIDQRVTLSRTNTNFRASMAHSGRERKKTQQPTRNPNSGDTRFFK